MWWKEQIPEGVFCMNADALIGISDLCHFFTFFDTK